MTTIEDRPLRVPDENIVLHWWRLLRWFSNLRLVPRRREHAARLLARVFRSLFYEGLTRPGKIILICSLLIFLFSYRSNSDFLLATAALGMSLILWAVTLGYIYRPRISAQRNTPATAVAGETLVSQIRVRNRGRLPLHNFAVREMRVPFCRWSGEWGRPHQVALQAEHETTITVGIEPQRRGLLTLTGVAVQSYFPFFLTRFTRRVLESTDVYVLPATLAVPIPSLRHIAEQASKRLKLGTDNTRKGPSLEYAYSRQYQTGDSLRRLDHRAGSRRGEPMSKIFEGADEIRRDQVYLMVDLTLENFQRWQPQPPDIEPLDERLALAVEIGLSAQNEGFSLTALAAGDAWHNLETLYDFYRLIATCEPLRAVSSAGKVIPKQVQSKDGLHILVVGRWTVETQSHIERWQRDGILVLVFLIPETIDDVGTLPPGKQFVEISLPKFASKLSKRAAKQVKK